MEHDAFLDQLWWKFCVHVNQKADSSFIEPDRWASMAVIEYSVSELDSRPRARSVFESVTWFLSMLETLASAGAQINYADDRINAVIDILNRFVLQSAIRLSPTWRIGMIRRLLHRRFGGESRQRFEDDGSLVRMSEFISLREEFRSDVRVQRFHKWIQSFSGSVDESGRRRSLRSNISDKSILFATEDDCRSIQLGAAMYLAFMENCHQTLNSMASWPELRSACWALEGDSLFRGQYYWAAYKVTYFSTDQFASRDGAGSNSQMSLQDQSENMRDIAEFALPARRAREAAESLVSSVEWRGDRKMASLSESNRGLFQLPMSG